MRHPWPNARGPPTLRSRTAGLPAAVGGVGLVPVFPPDSAPRDSCRSTWIFGGFLPPPSPSRHPQEAAAPETGDLADFGQKGPTSTELTPHQRVPRGPQLLRRVLHLDALACPRFSTASRSILDDRSCVPDRSEHLIRPPPVRGVAEQCRGVFEPEHPLCRCPVGDSRMVGGGEAYSGATIHPGACGGDCPYLTAQPG